MFIKLTEIINKDGKPVEHPTIINTAFILGVAVGEFANTDKGIHIVGESTVSMVSLIQLSVGRPVFVKESIEDIDAMLDSVSLMKETGKRPVHGVN